MSINGARLLVLGGLLLASQGCKQPHPGWEPPLEETSTRFLQAQVDEALGFVQRAQRDLRGDPGQAEAKLRDAARALERMSGYYLPLLEARERAYDAHRFLYYGETSRARAELEAVEEILDTVAETGGPVLQPALREPLDLASEAKAAVIAGTDNAADSIRTLTILLNQMALRGGLDLPDDWPQGEGAAGV
jgi:hypothetical protein